MERFCDEIFVVWEHGADILPSFSDYLKNVHEARKIKFTMEMTLEFLDLRIKCVDDKLSGDVFAKPTKSFTCVNPSTCYRCKSVRVSTTYHVELLLDYAKYVTLMRSLNFVLINISNI